MRASLSQLAEQINAIAISTVEEDGAHAPMFFLRLSDGSVEPKALESGVDPPGEAWGQEMAEAAATSSADAIVFVSEAWRASPGSVPQGGRPRDSKDAHDALLVVALDRLGNQLMFATTLSRGRDGRTFASQTASSGPESTVQTLNAVRSLWGLPRRLEFLGGAFSVAVPPGWSVSEDGNTVELEPPTRRGAAHFSVYRRGERRDPAPGEATEFVQRAARLCGAADIEVHEDKTRDGIVAVASFNATPRRWRVGARISPLRAVLYTYNDDGNDQETWDTAAAVFDSIVVSDR